MDVFSRSLKTVRDNLGEPTGFHYIDYETGMFVWVRRTPQARNVEASTNSVSSSCARSTVLLGEAGCSATSFI